MRLNDFNEMQYTPLERTFQLAVLIPVTVYSIFTNLLCCDYTKEEETKSYSTHHSTDASTGLPHERLNDLAYNT